MPRSWLKPAFAVQRSALPLTSARQLFDGIVVSDNHGGVGEIGGFGLPSVRQVLPLLFVSWNWDVGALSATLGLLGRNTAARLVGEYAPAMGPSPARIGAPSARLAFDGGLFSYVVVAVTGHTFCTKS